MKPRRCFHEDDALEEAARLAEQRKRAAMGELAAALGGSLDDRIGQDPDAFETAMRALIDADKAALRARGR